MVDLMPRVVSAIFVSWMLTAGGSAAVPGLVASEEATATRENRAAVETDADCLAEFCERWWQRDLANLRKIPRLLDPLNLTPAFLENAVERGDLAAYDPPYDLGFGATRTELQVIGGGYLSGWLQIVHYEGALLSYRLELSHSRRPRVQELLDDAWKSPEGTILKRKETGLELTFHQQTVAADLEAHLARELGSSNSVAVTKELHDSYSALVEPLDSLWIGTVCGLGAMRTSGLRAVMELMASQRLDLLENVLRCPNPGGRIYAAAALRRLEAKGLKLSEESLRALRKVEALPLEVFACSGCEVFRVSSAQALADLMSAWDH